MSVRVVPKRARPGRRVCLLPESRREPTRKRPTATGVLHCLQSSDPATLPHSG